MEKFIVPFLFVIAVGVIGILTEVFGSRRLRSEGAGLRYQYQRKKFFLSWAEHEFYDVLVGTVGNQYYVFAQVHLETLLDHKVYGQNWHGAFRHIDEKSVDFVLCDKAYISPRLVIELDDSTHGRPDRIQRDREVERILASSGLPILRFKVQDFYNPEEIAAKISEVMRSQNHASAGSQNHS